MYISKKKALSLLSVILVFALFISVALPYGNVYAKTNKEIVNTEIKRPINLKSFPKKSNKPIEVPGLKKANQQAFLNPNGSLTVEVYAEPQFWKNKQGKWEAIDNSIVTNENAKFPFKNSSNDIDIWFAKDISNNAINRVQHEDNFVEFIPQNTKTSIGVTSGNKIEYNDIYPNVNINYSVLTNGVKEDIVLLNSKSQNSFSFQLLTNGLTPILNDNKTISYLDKNNKEIFLSASPFAYDNNQITTENVTFQLRQEGDNWFIDLTLDNAWLQDANRAFPVTIDPTTYYQPGASKIKDTYAASGYPDTNYYLTTYLVAGNNTNGTNRSFIEFTELPQLYSGATITNATLDLYQFVNDDPNNNTTIDVHRITENWSSSSVTWNAQPAVDSNILTSITNNVTGTWNFDVTDTVKAWYNADLPNYGLMLRANNETTSNRRGFYSSDATPSTTPKLTITYDVNPLGAENFWSYVGNVNTDNGNMLLSATDVYLLGKGIPIQVGRSYNSQSTNYESTFAYGWQLNVGMNLKINQADNRNIVFNDADGTKHFFVKQTIDGVTKYVAPPGVDLQLEYQENPAYYIITDKGQTKYYFAVDSGRLEKMVDSNNNTTTLAYNLDGTLSSITDPSSRVVNFNYVNGKLDTITGDKITTVKYIYDASNDLVEVQKIDGSPIQSVQYDYDAAHHLTSITDPNGHNTVITYNGNNEVATVSNDVTDIDSVTQTLTLSYAFVEGADKHVKITDPDGTENLYYTNDKGNVSKIIQNYDGTDPTQTNEKNITTILDWDANNRVILVTDSRNNQTDLLYDKNGNIERITDTNNQDTRIIHDDKNNVIQETDPTGATTNNHYDGNNNTNASINALAGTVINNYDSSGNLIQVTSPLSIGDNEVVNSGFEAWNTSSDVKDWTNIGYGQVSQSTESVNGSYTLELTSNGTIGDPKLISEYIPVKGDRKYNVSWLIKTANITNSADVEIYWYDDNLSSYMEKTNGLASSTGTIDWSRKAARVKAPATAKYARVLVYVYDGTAWYDNIQFSEGTYSNTSNLVINNGFQDGLDALGNPINWGDSFNINTAVDGLDMSQGNNSTSSLTLTGDASAAKYYGQNMLIGGKAGTAIHFSGYSKAQGINPTGGDYVLFLRVVYNDLSEDYLKLYFNKSDHDWELQESTVTIPNDFKSIGIYAKLENQTGQAWFDDIKVNFTGVSNALISKYNIAQNGSFEYDLDTNSIPDEWQKYNETAATMQWVNGLAYVGDYSVSIKDSTSWASYASVQNEPIKAGETYTATAMIRTDNVTSGGGLVKIALYDSNGAFLNEKVSDVVSNSSQWKRAIVTITEQEAKNINPNAVSMKVVVGVNSATTGTVYFDAVRWETGDVTKEISYDINGNYVKTVTDQLGNTITYSQDSRGNITQVQSDEGSIITLNYDKLDRIQDLHDSTHLWVDYQYDNNGNITNINYKKESGEAISQVQNAYDELNRIKQINDPLNNKTSFKYDQDSNLADILYPNGNQAHFAYDALNRLTTESYTGDSTTWDYQYDKSSNLTQVTKSNPVKTEVTNYTIDPKLNRVNSISYPDYYGASTGHTIDYEYDSNNQITKITNQAISSTPIIFGYDQSGRMTSVTGLNNISTAYMHNEAGKLKKSYEKVGASTNAYNTYYEYNDAGMLSHIRQETAANGTVLYDNSFVYDKNGNITEITNMDGSKEVYTYDLSSRLTLEQHLDSLGTVTREISYTYDEMGNRLTKTQDSVTTNYSYDAANQLTQVDSTAWTYDENGNLITDGINTFNYNANNQLTSVENSQQTTIAIYEYDHTGKRTKKVSGGETEYYYYNAGHLAYVTDGNNNLKYSFTRNQAGKLIAMTDHTGATDVSYYYVLNSHGDVIGLKDINGNMVVSYEYDAYGNILNSTGTITTGDGNKLLKQANPFRYAGYYYDEETWMYYLNARYYKPQVGRFITRDIVADKNLYQYSGDNPVMYVDPSGYRRIKGIDAYAEEPLNAKKDTTPKVSNTKMTSDDILKISKESGYRWTNVDVKKFDGDSNVPGFPSVNKMIKYNNSRLGHTINTGFAYVVKGYTDDIFVTTSNKSFAGIYGGWKAFKTGGKIFEAAGKEILGGPVAYVTDSARFIKGMYIGYTQYGR